MRKMIVYSLLFAAAIAMALVAASVVAQDETPVQDWPFAQAGGSYQVFEGNGVWLDASGSSGMGEIQPDLYGWDLNNDGLYEAEGFSVWFDASGLDGTQSRIVNLDVCVTGACDSDLATIDILNAPPQLDAGPDVTVYSGDAFSLSGVFTDPGINDVHIGTVNYDDGAGVVSAGIVQNSGGGLVTGGRVYYAPGTRDVRVCVRDDDGDSGCDNVAVTVQPVPVNIDIRPYVFPNTFNLLDEGSLRLAVLGSATFDVNSLNPNTVQLAGAHVYVYWYEDVNYDGRSDLVGRVWIPYMTISGTATSATVEAITYSGVYVSGSDSIAIVPPPAPTTYWSSTYPTLSWSRVNGGICYQVEIDNDADFSSPEQVATNVEGYYYSADPLPSGTYYWRVRVGGVCINVVQSGWSAPRSFTVP